MNLGPCNALKDFSASSHPEVTNWQPQKELFGMSEKRKGLDVHRLCSALFLQHKIRRFVSGNGDKAFKLQTLLFFRKLHRRVVCDVS